MADNIPIEQYNELVRENTKLLELLQKRDLEIARVRKLILDLAEQVD